MMNGAQLLATSIQTLVKLENGADLTVGSDFSYLINSKEQNMVICLAELIDDKISMVRLNQEVSGQWTFIYVINVPSSTDNLLLLRTSELSKSYRERGEFKLDALKKESVALFRFDFNGLHKLLAKYMMIY